MEKRPGSRIEEIDVLRGLAAFTVMVAHYTVNYRFFHGLPPLGWTPNGTYAVYLFFVISGFVIVMTLHRCRTLLDFVVSRFSRIFPAYWCAILITSAVLYLLNAAHKPTLPEIAVGFTMLERLLGMEHVDPVYWTLNVELSFYIWMGLLFALGGLNRILYIIPFALAFQALMGAYAHYVNHPFSQGVNVFLLLEYGHLFCAGMLFYEAREKGWTRWSLLLLLWCGLNQGTIRFREMDLVHPGLAAIVAIFVIFLLMAMIVRGSMRWIVNPVLVYMGTISYTVYILHSEIGLAIMDALRARGISYAVSVCAAVASVSLLASLLTFLVERPAMKWIRRLYKKDHPAAAIQVEPPPPVGTGGDDAKLETAN